MRDDSILVPFIFVLVLVLWGGLIGGNCGYYNCAGAEDYSLVTEIAKAL